MRRVVVTGLGLVSPVGIGVEGPWKALLDGVSGIAPITHFDTTDFATKFGGEIKGFEPEQWVDPKDVRRMDRFILYAMAAAKVAIEHAGLEITDSDAHRVGVYVGAGLGGLETLERYRDVVRDRGPRRISPFFIPMLIPNLAPGHISIKWGAKGPNMSHVSACATGAHAIGDAYEAILRGDADAMICGGCEATVTPLGVGGFNSMKALSVRNDEPARASRPFDRERDGFVIAEGSGILVIEELERARNRDARILAEIVGYGLTADAHHITAPAPEGEGAARCMKMALDDGGIAPEDVQYINAHGTSTPHNDANETKAIKTVFGDHARRLMVSSTKSMTGHMLGAAGGVEAAISVLSLVDQAVPPTINYEVPDPDCDLDYVPNEARQAKLDVVMSNAFGFGGTNACLVFRRF